MLVITTMVVCSTSKLILLNNGVFHNSIVIIKYRYSTVVSKKLD